jgi:hypothetical protein
VLGRFRQTVLAVAQGRPVYRGAAPSFELFQCDAGASNSSHRRKDALSRSIFPLSKNTRRKERSNAALRRTLVDVDNAGERLSHIRASILGLQRIVPFVIATEPKWMGAAIVTALKSTQADLASLADYETQLICAHKISELNCASDFSILCTVP